MIRGSLILLLGVSLSACFTPVMEDDGGFGGGTGAGGAVGGGGGSMSCDGCVLPTGVCVPRANTTALNCGANGAACLACSAGQTCSDGLCTGGSGGGAGGGGGATCTGCVAPNSNGCVPLEFTDSVFCGAGGSTCRACSRTERCVNGGCAAGTGGGGGGTCLGCFEASTGTCVPPEFTNRFACGNNGSVCLACGAGQSCVNGACLGMPVGGGAGGGVPVGGGGGGPVGGGGGSCSGCTLSNGLCVQAGFTGPSACGANGSACLMCGTGQSCTNGVCVGGPIGGGGGGGPVGGGGGSACDGCVLASGTCVPLSFTSVVNCGANGSMCIACGSGQVCSGGRCVTVSTGGGGGTTCDGCFLADGRCLPLNRTSSVNCGANGTTCQSCGANETCSFGRCTPVVTTKRVGDACTSDMECQAGLGAAGLCKRTTSSGNATYLGGYCTLRCGSAGSFCPFGSQCVASAGPRGESDAICWDNCGANDACRNPGYACYALGTASSACWIAPLPSAFDGGMPTGGGGGGMPVGGGAGGGGGSTGCSAATCAGCCSGSTCVPLGSQSSTACGARGSSCTSCGAGLSCSNGACTMDPGTSHVGDACTSDLQCRPPNTGFCIAESVFGQPTGWPGGSCSATCNGTPCPTGSACVDVGGSGGQNLVCLETCPAPRLGQSTCRLGYLCEVNLQGTGGICIPRCNTIGFNCPSNTTCDSTTGYCRAGP